MRLDRHTVERHGWLRRWLCHRLHFCVSFIRLSSWVALKKDVNLDDLPAGFGFETMVSLGSATAPGAGAVPVNPGGGAKAMKNLSGPESVVGGGADGALGCEAADGDCVGRVAGGGLLPDSRAFICSMNRLKSSSVWPPD